MSPSAIGSRDGLDIDRLMDLSAQWLLTTPDVNRFLDRMAEQGPLVFADVVTDDPAAVAAAPASRVLRADAPRFFRGLGWSIASQMPLPALGWRPHRLVPPGRNERCLCGSGAKYKHCCQDLVERGPRMDPVYLGSVVVRHLPVRDRPGLPASRVHPDMVAAAAHAWREQGRVREALRLLEPWGQAPPPWDAARAELLDLLADLYLEQGHPRKRKALADAMVRHGDTTVQSLGWQRRSMMASDAGDRAAARAAFERAQRLTPDDPRVALLEVTTLLGTGEFERAHERAAFHARRLERLPHAAELAPQIEGLWAIARGEMDHLAPAGRGGEAHGEDNEDDEGDEDDDLGPDLLDALPRALARLRAWVDGLPAPRLRLDLSRATAQDLGELRPAPALRQALSAWRGERAPADDAGGLRVFEMERWCTLLERHPALGDCFEVLDDLVTALAMLPFGLGAGPQAALMQRALALWTLLRERHPRALCEWGWLDNRPALRLLVRAVETDRTPKAEHSFEWLRALVEVLNPHDNHGLRERLGAVLLRRGDPAAALALADRYPDDFVGTELVRTRALLALQRLPEAEAAWAGVLRANPHVPKLLRSPRAPRLPDGDSYRVGSPEQAKLVVAEQHDLWRDKPLQAWLRDRADGESPQLTLT